MSDAGKMRDVRFWRRTMGCVALPLMLAGAMGAQTVQTAKAGDGPAATGVSHPPPMQPPQTQPASGELGVREGFGLGAPVTSAATSATIPAATYATTSEAAPVMTPATTPAPAVQPVVSATTPAVPPATPAATSAAGPTVQPVITATTPAVQPSEVTPLQTAVTEVAPDRKQLPEGDFYYIVEPGDTVTVSFRFTPEFNDEVTVGPDGRAELKSVGDVKLAGMTLPEIQRLIVRESASKLVNPEVTVSLKDFQRPQVVVAGEVQTPGHFELRKPTTVLQAILMAGGPKEDGAMGHVVLFRKLNSETAEVHVLKLGKYDAKDRAANDLVLQPDDMILVTHDRISKIDRYVKLINLGVYLNPLGNNGVF
jgi:polysaccharide export outer membrane protein